MTKQRITEDQIKQSAAKYGLEYAAVRAVMKVESSGSGFHSNGFPTILFEGHIFSRLTSRVYDLKYPDISYPKWTRQFYTGTQDGEQNRLARASKLNRNAALKSASYGLFQIMGFNYEKCGCKTLQEFINRMCSSEQDQLELFLEFVENSGLIPALKEKNWALFASRYNGPEYKKNRYDEKLAKAYESFV